MKCKLTLFLAVLTALIVVYSATAQTVEPVVVSVNAPPLSRKAIYNDLGPSVQVGSRHKLVVKFTNKLFRDRKYLKYAKKKKIKPNIKMTAYVEWGAMSWPVLQSQGGTMVVDDDRTSPIPPTKWIKPHKSRTMTFLVNFKACLPPWAPDPQTPGTLDPNNRVYFGLPCASGGWYLRTKAYIKGLGWSSWSSPLGGRVYVTP